ncbi:MAG: hypothetical protein V1809_13660 [Planctomycetota bacterium]
MLRFLGFWRSSNRVIIVGMAIVLSWLLVLILCSCMGWINIQPIYNRIVCCPELEITLPVEGCRIVKVSKNGEIVAWKLRNGKVTIPFDYGKHTIDVEFSRDGNVYAMGFFLVQGGSWDRLRLVPNMEGRDILALRYKLFVNGRERRDFDFNIRKN